MARDQALSVGENGRMFLLDILFCMNHLGGVMSRERCWAELVVVFRHRRRRAPDASDADFTIPIYSISSIPFLRFVKSPACYAG